MKAGGCTGMIDWRGFSGGEKGGKKTPPPPIRGVGGPWGPAGEGMKGADDWAEKGLLPKAEKVGTGFRGSTRAFQKKRPANQGARRERHGPRPARKK